MSRFLTLSYYLSPLPESNFQYSKVTFAFCALLFLAAVAVHVYRKKYLKDDIARRILRPYPGLLLTYGVIASFLLFVRETSMPYLSMRLWWLVLLAFMLYSGIKLAMTYKKQHEKKSGKSKVANSRNKYLPKKKRR